MEHSMIKYRLEKDALGEFQVLDDAWYGIQTARAVKNFNISNRKPDADFVRAQVQIKYAAAIANCQPNWLNETQRDAIVKACEKILSGEFMDQFVVDPFQAGAGTSHNMNANEVIANLANVSLKGEKGKYTPIHLNDHVNMSQSTNDTIPTAIRLAVLAKLPKLNTSLAAMITALENISAREQNTIKSGRTHLQDAVPITIGKEFEGYAWTLKRIQQEILQFRPRLCQIGLGGTAVGTGLNSSPNYTEKVIHELSKLSDEELTAGHQIAQMQSMFDLQNLSALLRGLALELTRISNDLRLLASGPRTGLNEIVLPAVQPGSSIMPGKVNPVMFEMLNQVCYQVLGQDAAVTYMTQAGQLELNVMMPALGQALFDAINWLTNAVKAAAENLAGLIVNRDRCAYFIDQSVSLITLLNPQIGYSNAAAIAKESQQTGKLIREIVAERGIMTREEFDQLVLRAAKEGKID
jgi:aspartate ammonia-lyase